MKKQEQWNIMSIHYLRKSDIIRFGFFEYLHKFDSETL